VIYSGYDNQIIFNLFAVNPYPIVYNLAV